MTDSVTEGIVLTKLYTGKFDVGGIGRVGSKGAARKAGRSRPRKYWAIFEFVGPFIGSRERKEYGKFKSKRAANIFLLDKAIMMGVKATTFGNAPNIDSYIDVDINISVEPNPQS